MCSRPEGTTQKSPFVLPLQGKCPHDHCTQGDTLGYDCHCAFSATKPAFHFFAGVVFCRASNVVRLFRAWIKLGLIRRAVWSCSIASEIRPICARAAPRLLCAEAELGVIRNACLK